MPLDNHSDAIDRRWHGAAFLALMGLGLAIYSPVLTLLPLRGDNLYTLAWVDQAGPRALFGLDPAIYPEWRPLAYQTIWLEHALLDLRSVGVHHFVNLTLWVTCAWLVYRLVHALGGTLAAGLAAAVLVLIDRRAVEALTWIVERQTTLACVFGLLALLLVVRASSRPLTRRQGLAIALLLLGAGLSKEYGLAFGAALACQAVAQRRRDLVLASLCPLVGYGLLRVSVAGGAFGGYCEEMGYFFSVDHQCVLPLSASGAGQMAYNVVANGVGILLQGVLDNEGAISPTPAALGLGALMLAAAVYGWRFARVQVGLLALVVVFNALLGVVLYRGRNQLVGLCAVAVVTGLGISLWRGAAVPPRQSRLAPAFAGALVALMAWQAFDTRLKVASDVKEMLAQDPCDSALRERAFADRFAKRVKITYGMTDPGCLETPAAD